MTYRVILRDGWFAVDHLDTNFLSTSLQTSLRMVLISQHCRHHAHLVVYFMQQVSIWVQGIGKKASKLYCRLYRSCGKTGGYGWSTYECVKTTQTWEVFSRFLSVKCQVFTQSTYIWELKIQYVICKRATTEYGLG